MSNSVRRRTQSFAAVAAGALLVLGLAAPAAAHDRLIDSTPADGDNLDTAPSEITTTFSANVMEQGAVISVTDAAGEERAVGDARVNGTDVTVDVDPEMAAGDATIDWRVVSSDGHPIEGTISFSVVNAAPASDSESPDESAAEGPDTAADEPSATADSADSGDAADTAADDTSAEDTAADTADSETTSDASGIGATPFVVGGISVLAIVALLVAVLRRKTPPTADSTNGANNTDASNTPSTK